MAKARTGSSPIVLGNPYVPGHAGNHERLAANGSVDFEDMLVQAADHLEAGNVKVHYDLIMADEFQDASRARAPSSAPW